MHGDWSNLGMDEGKFTTILWTDRKHMPTTWVSCPSFHSCHDPSIRFCYGSQVTWYNTLSLEDDPSSCWPAWTLWGDRSGVQDRGRIVITWVFVSTTDPARSKAQVCGRSLAGIAGSIPTCGISVSYEFCVLSEFYETGRSLVQACPTECVCVCVCVCVFVSVSVIRCENNPLHLPWVGRGGQDKKESVWLTNKDGC